MQWGILVKLKIKEAVRTVRSKIRIKEVNVIKEHRTDSMSTKFSLFIAKKQW